MVTEATYTGDANTVDALSKDSEEWLARSILPRTLMQGTYGMKKAGKTFLSQHTLETDVAYERRLENSTLLNAYRKTCSFLAGQVFQAEVQWAEDVNQIFKEWSVAIDVGGNDLAVFAKRVFQNGLAKGVAHILIDTPEKDPNIITAAEETAAGVRPYFKEIRPEDILGGIVDESGFLAQLRISETTTKRVGKFGTKIVKQIRVLEPGLWELYELNDDGEYLLAKEGKFSINQIPLVTFIPGEEWTVLTGETPLMDLGELNRKHWRSSSDQDNILSVVRVPILFGKNINIEKMPVGTSTLVTTEDNDADMKFIEHSGAAIAAGDKDLKETEAQMGLYGLQQLLPREGSQTATEKSISSSESSSSLGTWVTEFETVLTLAFQIAGSFMNQVFPDKGVMLNKEFSYGVSDSQELAQVLALYTTGILSAQSTFSEMKRRGVIVESLTWEDNKAEQTQEVRDAPNFAGLAGATFGDNADNGGLNNDAAN